MGRPRSGGWLGAARRLAWILALLAVLAPVAGETQPRPPRAGAPPRPVAPPVPPGAVPGGPEGGDHTSVTPEGLVNLDFEDVEIAAVIDTIARLTGKNFIYDDRVRGRVTIISPTPVPIEQAYTVFESVLQVKGFTTVEAPGGVLKVIPIRDAKETSVDTRESTGRTPDSDRFVTRLIPLRYIDAEAIANTLKPLVSKEAALVAYPPTNTIILTDSASNIRRILSILEAIDVETYKEELAVIRVEYADAVALADQLSQVFGAEVASAAATPGRAAPRVRRAQAPTTPQLTLDLGAPGGAQRGAVRIITDERTNALIILAARATLDEMRALIRKLDVPIEGGGRIQVYYVRHADAEELADTLNALLGGAPLGGAGGGGVGGVAAQAAQLRGLADLAGTVQSVTADPATNSLVIQASPEGFESLLRVIEKLDIERPQVLVEALIMEVDVSDGSQLGFNGVLRLVGDEAYPDFTVGSVTDSVTQAAAIGSTAGPLAAAVPFFLNYLNDARGGDGEGSVIQTILRASQNDNNTNVLSAPHVLTSDNEEAEILIGQNIPIVTSRVTTPQSVTDTGTGNNTTNPFNSSVNVERQDIGVTLRVTPQITEGDAMRLEIFQEITNIANITGFDPATTGPALTNRRVENVVVVSDGDTVVIGGLVSDKLDETETKVPWLGDVPVLGWLFKTRTNTLEKINLLVFLTPHIVRSRDDLEKASIGKREEFRKRSQQALDEPEGDRPEVPVEEPIGLLADVEGTEDPAAGALAAIEKRHPLERMREIERKEAEARARAQAGALKAGPQPRYVVLAGSYGEAPAARARLTELIDAGYQGRVVSSGAGGRLVLELRVGPYTVGQAETAADTLRRAYGMAPQVLVERAEPAP